MIPPNPTDKSKSSSAENMHQHGSGKIKKIKVIKAQFVGLNDHESDDNDSYDSRKNQ